MSLFSFILAFPQLFTILNWSFWLTLTGFTGVVIASLAEILHGVNVLPCSSYLGSSLQHARFF